MNYTLHFFRLSTLSQVYLMLFIYLLIYSKWVNKNRRKEKYKFLNAEVFIIILKSFAEYCMRWLCRIHLQSAVHLQANESFN